MVAAWRPVSTPSPPASTPTSSTSESSTNAVNRPIALDPPPTQATAASGSLPVSVEHLGASLVADAACQVAHHARERVRSCGGAEQVGRRVDAGDPVAQRLVDRVLQRAAAALDRDDLGAQHLHARDVERLALGVDLAHVDRALEVEVRARRCRRDAVLACSGLGDRARLADALGQQCLADDVADLVRAGVVEVFALEQDAGAGGLGEPVRFVQRARDVGVLAQHPVELGHERRIGLGVGPGGGELVEWGDQGLGHESAAESAEMPAGVGLCVCSHGCAFREQGSGHE